MAEGILRKLLRDQDQHHEIVVESAGTHPLEGAAASQTAIEISSERGIDLRGHVARPLSARLVERADLILTMEPEHGQRMAERFPGANGKTHLLTTYADPGGDPLGVPDPYGADRETYEEAFGLIERSLQDALPRMLDHLRDRKGRGGDPPSS
jgi:protein-tyrosine-phosphatase